MHDTEANPAPVKEGDILAGKYRVERVLGVPPERIAVCSPGAPDWKPRAAAPKDGYVLFFGTLEPRKNVSGLLDRIREGMNAV